MYTKKVSPKKFREEYYEKSVKAFEEKKNRNLQKMKEEAEKKEKEALSLKPQLNDNKNKNIRRTHEQRINLHLCKKRKDINVLKKELEQKKLEEEAREATFQPKLLAAKNNEKLLANLKAKQRAICEKVDSKNIVMNLDKIKNNDNDKQELYSFRPQLSKKTLQMTVIYNLLLC